MEPAQKKPGFFSGFRFSSWRNAEPPVEKDQKESYYRTVEAGHTPPIPRVGFSASPESPAKRASAAQMSSRKILEQPRGPSSKLSNVMNSADLTSMGSSHAASTTFTSTTPRSMGFSSEPTYKPRPGAYSSATTPRNMFRQSGARDRPPFSFSPRVPYNTAKESFPPATPGRSLQPASAEVNGRGLSKTSSANLFPMRISSPPPELSGEALAKQVPAKTTHAGSIYADEFLAHLVPPGLDDVQRRQWFCILDLRRLKYAADEIFAKKDWKLNILSFAKEYEKSRSLIMLRYGLYEFKTKPSAELEKQWQKSNGIPTSDEEARPNGKLASGSRQLKRRAEDDLSQRDPAPQASSVNTNKRRATERQPLTESTPLASNKRKAAAVEESIENERAKAQKTPSASKSAMDKIFNASSRETGALKMSKSPAKTANTSKPNPFAALAKSTPNGVAPASKAATSGNIFGHLESAPEGDEDDADTDSGSGESESESEEESENQDESQSDEPSVAVSGGVSTPNYGGVTSAPKAAGPGAISLSSESSEAGEPRKERSLFDRISYGADGKALRVLGPEDRASQLGSEGGRSASPEKTQATPAVDHTWKPESAIKFSSSVASPIKFASAATQEVAPAAQAHEQPVPSIEVEADGSGTETPRPEAASKASSIFAPKQDAPAGSASSIFAPKLQGSSTGGASSIFAPKPAEAAGNTGASSAASVFAPKSTSAFPTNSSSSLFAQKTPADTSAKPAPANLFGAPKAESQTPAAPAAATPSTIFGAKSETAASSANKPNNIFQSSTLFGSKSDGAEKPAAPQSNLFASKAPEESGAKSGPATSIFAASAEMPKSNIFGSTASTTGFGSATAAVKDQPAAAKPETTPFGGQSSSSSAFGSNLFKPAAPAEPEKATSNTTKPAFGGLFGSASSQAEPMATSSSQPATSLFAKTTTPAATPSTSFTFGATPSQANAAPASQPGVSASFGSVGTSFNSVGSDGQPKFHNPFAQNQETTGSLSFDFGAGGGASTSASQGGSTPFVFGGGAPGGADQASSNMFAFGANGTTSSGPAFGTQNTVPTLSFGSDTQSQPNTAAPSAIFGAGTGSATSGGMFNLAGGSSQPNGSTLFGGQKPTAAANIFNLAPPGGGLSTGTNTPFTLGGASSLATTPATGTPEPGAEHDGEHADGDTETKHEQINLVEGGPGEEDEEVLHDVRAKAMKLDIGGSDGDNGSDSEAGSSDKKGSDSKKNPWKIQGLGPFRVLKHKTTGAVRMLLRQEPSGRVAMNKALLPGFNYRVEPGGKYIKLTTAKDAGSGFETWMLQLKTKEAAQALVDVLEANKGANKK